MIISEACKVFSSKAPVNHDGPQKTAAQAKRVLWPVLLKQERTAISTALSHACDGEGRREFDAIMLVVRHRLARLGLCARPASSPAPWAVEACRPLTRKD